MSMYTATIETMGPVILESQADGFADFSATDPAGAQSVAQQWDAKLGQMFPTATLESWTDMGFDLPSAETVFAALDALVAAKAGDSDGYPIEPVTYMLEGQDEPWYSCGRNCHTGLKQLLVARGESLELTTLNATVAGSNVTWKASVRLRYTVKALQVPG
jgi:hypothetical protein